MKYCVVVANGSRARFFSLVKPNIPDLASGPKLVERSEMADPELQERAQDLWTARPGKNRGPRSQGHAYDDHRDNHHMELERRFAQSVAERAAKLSKMTGATNLVLCGAQRQLPVLKQALEQQLQDTRVTELAKDLSKLDPQPLHDHLTKEGLLPPRKAT